jgi:hypothetical protein
MNKKHKQNLCHFFLKKKIFSLLCCLLSRYHVSAVDVVLQVYLVVCWEPVMRSCWVWTSELDCLTPALLPLSWFFLAKLFCLSESYFHTYIKNNNRYTYLILLLWKNTMCKIMYLVYVQLITAINIFCMLVSAQFLVYTLYFNHGMWSMCLKKKLIPNLCQYFCSKVITHIYETCSVQL